MVLPPPPTAQKPRNESMSAQMPTYRNRPSGSSSSNPATHFANAKSLFESLNTPAIRNGVTQLAKNPLAQRAAVAVAKNDAARTAVINAAQTHATGNKEPDPLVSKMAHGSILGMVKQFENKPIMQMGSGGAPPGDRTSSNSYSYEPPRAEMPYNNLTAIDPFEYPPQLPSSHPPQDSYYNRSKSTDPYSYMEKKQPTRPPPPKVSNSWSNPSLGSPETLTNKAHAIAKYPYKANQMDELSFEQNDTLLLEREIDDQWVSAVNTRTGSSGIVPLGFLEIKIPLAPSSATMAVRSVAYPPPAVTSPTGDSWGSKQVMKALYDYRSDVDGDLSFNAGDMIVVHERVNQEWFSGQLKNKFGIFPASYVQPADGSSSQLPVAAPLKTVTALYDYNSGVPEDLQFFANDRIEVVEEMSAEWIKGRLRGKEGLVPITYVQR